MYCVLVLVSLAGCAVGPIKVSSVLDTMQPYSANKVPAFKYTFIDGRSDDFKVKDAFVFRNRSGFPEFTYGDPKYDMKLFDLFTKAVKKRLPENVDSQYELEMTLEDLHVLMKTPVTSGVSSSLAGVMTVDVAVSDKAEKSVFQKRYHYEISEPKFAHSAESEEACIVAALSKLLDQFTAECLRDLGQIPS